MQHGLSKAPQSTQRIAQEIVENLETHIGIMCDYHWI